MLVMILLNPVFLFFLLRNVCCAFVHPNLILNFSIAQTRNPYNDQPYTTNARSYIPTATTVEIYDPLAGVLINNLSIGATQFRSINSAQNDSIIVISKGSNILRYINLTLQNYSAPFDIYSISLFNHGNCFVGSFVPNKCYSFDFTNLNGIILEPIIGSLQPVKPLVSPDGQTLIIFSQCRIFKYINPPNWTFTQDFNLSCMNSTSISMAAKFSENNSYLYAITGLTSFDIINISSFTSIGSYLETKIQWIRGLTFTNSLNDEVIYEGYIRNQSIYGIIIYNLGMKQFVYLKTTVRCMEFHTWYNQKKLMVIKKKQGYQIYNIICPQFSNYSQIDQKCKVCLAECAKCSNDTWLCLSCLNTTLVLSNGTCICPLGFNYSLLASGCIPCPTQCAACSNQTWLCLSCFNSNVLILGMCLPSFNCIDGFYFDSLLYKCLPCNQICQKCTNSSNKCLIYRFGFSYDSKLNQVNQNIFFNLLGALYSTPTLRKSFMFASQFFISFDSIWLYQYHDRPYGSYMKTLFQAIRNLESQKYTFLSIDLVTNKINDVYVSQIPFPIQNYENQTDSTFLSIQRQDWSFFSNIPEYMFIHWPFTFIVFFICNRLFYFLFNFEVSSYLRRYSFWTFFFICLFEPNIQYFVYLSTNQMSMSFSLKLSDRIGVMLWVLFFFGVTLFAASEFYFAYYFTGKHAKYFIENCYRITTSFTWITFEIGFKNFMIGFIHSIMLGSYKLQIASLLTLQFLSIINTLYCWKQYGCFRVQIYVSFKIVNCFCMILFQFLLIIQPTNTLESNVIEIFDYSQFLMTMIIFVNCLVISLFQIIMLICEIILKPNEQLEIDNVQIEQYNRERQAQRIQEKPRIQQQQRLQIKQEQKQKRIQQTDNQKMIIVMPKNWSPFPQRKKFKIVKSKWNPNSMKIQERSNQQSQFDNNDFRKYQHSKQQQTKANYKYPK